MRSLFVIGAVLVVASCASAGPTVPTDAVGSTQTTTVGAPSSTAVRPDLDSSEAAPDGDAVERSVRIDVDVDGSTAELSGTVGTSADPFGAFVSCSGVRAAFGTYSVLASAVEGSVRSISIASSDLASTPGVHDAGVRVEFATGSPIDAIGTMTLSDDFRSGSFIAFDIDGGVVEGSFECNGPGLSRPEPLPDESAAIEVIALLRSGDAQRLVGLVATGETASEVACPGMDATSPDDVAIVRAMGDESIGAITTFELTGGDMPSLRLQVGAVMYEFDDVRVGDPGDESAGTFAAESSDASVDGAFRCS